MLHQIFPSYTCIHKDKHLFLIAKQIYLNYHCKIGIYLETFRLCFMNWLCLMIWLCQMIVSYDYFDWTCFVSVLNDINQIWIIVVNQVIFVFDFYITGKNTSCRLFWYTLLVFSWIISWKKSTILIRSRTLKFLAFRYWNIISFNNHVKVQNRDSLVDIYHYTFHILFTLLLIVDQNLTKLLSFRIKLHNSRKINYGIIFYN